MHLYKLVAILLILVELNVANATHECYHDNIEGQIHDLESGRTAFFAIDFTAQRYYETTDPASHVFDIIDFGGGYHYRFEGGNCRTRVFESVRFFEHCIDDEFNLPSLSLGELDKGIDVRFIGVRVRDVDTTVVVTYTNGGYLPLFRYHVDANNRVSTAFFSDLTDSISARSNRIYTDTTNCVQDDWTVLFF